MAPMIPKVGVRVRMEKLSQFSSFHQFDQVMGGRGF